MQPDISRYLRFFPPLGKPIEDGRKFHFHTDDYFTIGSSHHVCEDYSRCFDFKEITPSVAVFVSDGCSSSKDTDFGSRSLVLSAQRCIQGGPIKNIDVQRLMWFAEHPRELSEGCLDATLMAAYSTPTGYIKVQVFGDGVVSVRRRNGSLETYIIDQGGAPAYPSYFSSPDRMEALKKAGFGGRKVTVIVDGEEKAIWEWTPDELESFPDFTFLVDPRDTDLVVLMSDGVESFQDISDLSPVPVPLAEVLPHIVGFKNLKGSFVKRRLNAFEKKTLPKKQWQHYDDLGVGAIYIEEIIEEEGK